MDLYLDLGAQGWALGLGLTLAVVGLGLRWPILLLMLALASLAIRPQLLWGGPAIGHEWGLHHILMVMALLANAWHFGLRKQIPWPIAALAAVFALNLLFGELDPDLSPGFMLGSLVLLSLPFGFTQINLPPHARSLCTPVIMALPLLSVALGAALQIAGLHVTFAGLHDRLEGATGNAGVFGILAFCGLTVALHECTRRKRLWAILPAAVNLALVIFSGSRGALLVSAVLLVAYPLASKPFREQLYRRPLVILSGIVLAGAASAAYLPTVYQRLQLKMDRIRVWEVFYDEFLKSPLFGRGIGSGFVAGLDWPADVEKPFLPVPHNEYLHLLVNGGIVGFLLCMAAIIYWYSRLIRSAAEEDRFFLIALLPALAAFAVTENVMIHACALALYVYLGLVGQSRPSGATVDRSEERKSDMGGRKRHPAAGLFIALSVMTAAMAGGADRALGDEHCAAPTSERQTLSEHLRTMAAKAVTVEGPDGITVDFVAHPLPPYPGNPWSHWGEGLLASDGRYYTGIGDHRGVDGNAYLYEYDPATKTLRAVGDVLQAYGRHDRGAWGYGKIHGRISEDRCGFLYFSTYWGTRRGGLRYAGSYQGDLLMRYDPAGQQLVSQGVPMPTMGSPSTQMWPEGGLFYGEANHPVTKGADWPEGKLFWAYDLDDQKVIFRSENLIDHGSGREIAVDRDGRAYYSGAGRDLLRYDPKANAEQPIASFPHDGQLRASTRPAPDGKIFLTTKKENRAYLFDPEAKALKDLGALPSDTASLALSESGEAAYFTPGAHGQGRDLGFPLMTIDRDGNVEKILDLGPLIEAAGGPYPAGTYSYSTDPAHPGNIYILANAGPNGSAETFGQPLVIVVHLPPEERR